MDSVKGRIRKTYGPLSSGTRCEILSNPNKKDGDTNWHGYVTIRVGPFSRGFYEQNHPLAKSLKATDGVFDIEADLVEVTDDN